MGIQFFGEFLIDRWVITRGQLLEALELQQYRNPKLGELAVQKGMLTEEQVETLNLRQRQEDMRFGELAVKEGLLTEDQVKTLLTQQKNDYLYLGESLLELGHVTEDILERELAIFKEEQERFAQDAVSVPEGTSGATIIAACVDLTRKMFLRVVWLVVKVSDGETVPPATGSEGGERRDFHLTVAVPMICPEPVRYSLSVSSEVAVAVASKILGEDATRESEEIVEDAVKEFCNIVCGNVAARMAQQGVTVEISPPESSSGLPVPDDGQAVVRYPLKITDGEAELRFVLSAVPAGAA